MSHISKETTIIEEFELRGFTVRETLEGYEIGYYILNDVAFLVEWRCTTFRGVAKWIDAEHKALLDCERFLPQYELGAK